jgi:tRNA-uridine 2-sulfurtransferase
MSGGVDSSVSAALLRDDGYEVIGAMMRFWPDAKRVDTFDSCCSPDAAYEARRVADSLGIPFYLLDYRDVFEKNIIEPFVNEYKEGRTPNPCVLCNSKVKFDHLVKKSKMLGCDFVATGHFVRRFDTPTGPEFHRGNDPKKDQTYFLWGTPRESLEKVLFPVGHLEKPAVRELARGYGLITAEKPESQDICFVPGTIAEFLSERIKPQMGAVVDTQGNVVGEHEGTQFYTIGQKKGMKLFHSHLERYVIALDPEKNQVIVGTKAECNTQTLEVRGVNYLVDLASLPNKVMAQVRYRQVPSSATLVQASDTSFQLEFDEPQFAITAGQSAVIYDGSRLLGGGFIRERALSIPNIQARETLAV